MQTKLNLQKYFFTNKEKELISHGEMHVSVFAYDSGVQAVRIANKRGYIIVLPYLGQMVWDAVFDGKSLKMKSVFDEPSWPEKDYCSTYGCFLMHCGLSAMGNPTPQDTHLPHGELAAAKYDEAYLYFGEDDGGRYVSIGGSYNRKRCYEYNYQFTPLVKMYEDRTDLEVEVNFVNHKVLPLEYFYLCHINYLPVDGSTLEYTADRKKIVVHHEVPENYPKAKADATNAYLAKLDKDQSLMDTIGTEGQSYDPEIVFTCYYSADEKGDAYTMQILPDGKAMYVCHRPEELPFGMRWISRTGDEEALGMVLPATGEHMGYLYCKEKGYAKYLQSGEKTSYHLRVGLLDEEQANDMKNKIKKLGF